MTRLLKALSAKSSLSTLSIGVGVNSSRIDSRGTCHGQLAGSSVRGRPEQAHCHYRTTPLATPAGSGVSRSFRPVPTACVEGPMKGGCPRGRVLPAVRHTRVETGADSDQYLSVDFVNG